MTPSRTASPLLPCLVVCTPGTEQLVANELAALGVTRVRTTRGGIEARLRPRQLYAANLWLRCATRVLVRIGSFDAPDFASLERGARRIDWARWLPQGGTAGFRVTAHRSRLNHTGAIAQRLAEAAGVDPDDADDSASDVRDDEQPRTGVTGRARFVVRLDADEVTISVDSSGEPLYRRGWRTQVAKAPLRPTLAAAMLAAIGWPGVPADGPRPHGNAGGDDGARRIMLADPLCGSGTLAIEAALAAIGRPPAVGAEPGTFRHFAFEDWEDFAPGTWASVAGEAANRATPVTGGIHIIASDRDAGAVAATAANARRAGVDHVFTANHHALSAASPGPNEPPNPGDTAWVATNPPWGRRMGHDDLRNLYATLGNVVRSRFAGWNVALVATDRRIAGHSGLGLEPALRTTSGGQPIELLVAQAPHG